MKEEMPMEDNLRKQLTNLGFHILNASKNEIYLSMRFLDIPLSGLGFRLYLSTLTIGTDGENILYNPNYLMEMYQNDPVLVNRTYLHMLFHCLFRHILNGEGKDKDYWNLACDIAVESIVDQLDYKSIHLTVSDARNEIYDELKKELKVLTADGIYRVLLRKNLSYQELVSLQKEFWACDHNIWDDINKKSLENTETQAGRSKDNKQNKDQEKEERDQEDKKETFEDEKNDSNHKSEAHKEDKNEDIEEGNKKESDIDNKENSQGDDGTSDDGKENSKDRETNDENTNHSKTQEDKEKNSKANNKEDNREDTKEDNKENRKDNAIKKAGSNNNEGALEEEQSDSSTTETITSQDKLLDQQHNNKENQFDNQIENNLKNKSNPKKNIDKQSKNMDQNSTEDSNQEDENSYDSFDQRENQKKREELEKQWKDISEKTQTNLETFSKNASDEAEGLFKALKVDNRSRYDYKNFLKKFAVPKEEMQVDEDTFDYIFYTYGLSTFGNMPLVEPLEYKEVTKVEEFVIVIDTSGSCSGDLVKKFLKESFLILSSQESFTRKINVYIIQCDDQIQEVVKITSQEELIRYQEHFEIKGLGGTDFRPAFQYVNHLVDKKEFHKLKGLLYFTDGYGIYPSKRPNYDVAFVFMGDDYEDVKVPSWAMKLVIEPGGLQDEY